MVVLSTEAANCNGEQDSDRVDISKQGMDSGFWLDLHDQRRYTGVCTGELMVLDKNSQNLPIMIAWWRPGPPCAEFSALLHFRLPVIRNRKG